MQYLLVGLDIPAKACLFEQQVRHAIRANTFTLLSFQLLGTPAANPETQAAGTAVLRIVAQAHTAAALALPKFSQPIIDLVMCAYPGGTFHMEWRMGTSSSYMPLLTPQSSIAASSASRSTGATSRPPLRTNSDESSWEMVDDLPFRWARDFVPLGSAGSRLLNASAHLPHRRAVYLRLPRPWLFFSCRCPAVPIAEALDRLLITLRGCKSLKPKSTITTKPLAALKGKSFTTTTSDNSDADEDKDHLDSDRYDAYFPSDDIPLPTGSDPHRRFILFVLPTPGAPATFDPAADLALSVMYPLGAGM
ncbi:hypothetical protein K438DRAFT_1993361 [Mycena galopus ATCC 62051]|nr:hypothetical protein K438DRAFT_1993361 [Mycena galopus ATCC 62051]